MPRAIVHGKLRRKRDQMAAEPAVGIELRVKQADADEQIERVRRTDERLVHVEQPLVTGRTCRTTATQCAHAVHFVAT